MSIIKTRLEELCHCYPCPVHNPPPPTSERLGEPRDHPTSRHEPTAYCGPAGVVTEDAA